MTQALILAAGRGSRLNGSNSGNAKCLVQIGDRTLIEYQVEMLETIGVERIGVVVGHCQDSVRAQLGSKVEYIENPIYADTNSLYSLWLAKDWVEGDFILLNGDVLAHPAIFHSLSGATDTALTFDSTSGDEDEQMKVQAAGTFLRSLGKDLSQESTCGENVGLLSFRAAATRLLFQAAGQIIKEGGENSWAPAAVASIASKTPIECLDIAGLGWVEIDFPEDLRRARNEVWPEVLAELACRV